MVQEFIRPNKTEVHFNKEIWDKLQTMFAIEKGQIKDLE